MLFLNFLFKQTAGDFFQNKNENKNVTITSSLYFKQDWKDSFLWISLDKPSCLHFCSPLLSFFTFITCLLTFSEFVFILSAVCLLGLLGKHSNLVTIMKELSTFG